MDDIDRVRFMTAAEAVEYGLVDATMPPRRRNAGK
jgi:ATP-dependent protease ClpP protease subunit